MNTEGRIVSARDGQLCFDKMQLEPQNTWAWLINPSVPGLGTGQGSPDSQSSWSRLVLESGILMFFGTGLILEVPNPAAGNCLHFSTFDLKTGSL